MIRLPFGTAHYAAIVSTLALAISFGSLYVAKLSYDLSAEKERRELRDRMPAIDLQILPRTYPSSADILISILNRGDVNIRPQDITALPSLEAGEFYFSNEAQKLDLLKPYLSLQSIGTLAPKATGVTKAAISGVTDGKHDSFATEVELQFVVRLRFGDEEDTVRTFNITRHVRR